MLIKSRSEHITTDYSDELRDQATRDPIVVAAGVTGGISGFVQAVLVPELALQLVMKDMQVSELDARQIMLASAELGDLLNPEAEERVSEVMEVDDEV